MKVEQYIKSVFLKLTSRTVPYGDEKQFMETTMRDILPECLEKDEWGNYFCKIGESETVFTSHIDTVSKSYMLIERVIDDNFIKSDGLTNLGADDKAGMTIMFWMIKNKVPGLYYFFIGEEVGCIGSGAVSRSKRLNKYKRMVSFDRRGTTSVITHQSFTRTCSDDFADVLVKQLNKHGFLYELDDTGTYTDSAEFADDIPECTNISVGYYNEHTNSEKQDIDHLIRLAKVCLVVKWEELPVKRDPMKTEYGGYSRTYARSTSTKNFRSSSSMSSNECKLYGCELCLKCGDCGFYRNNYKLNHDPWDDYQKKNKSNRRFYDNGEGIVEITEPVIDVDPNTGEVIKVSEFIKEENFDCILDKFGDITKEELEVIKKCYMNLKSGYDIFFYDYVKSKLKE